MHKNLFVFDIETVIDTDICPELTGVDDPNINVRRKAIEDYHLQITSSRATPNPFARQLFHKIVAISILHTQIEKFEDGTEMFHLNNVFSGKSDNEKELIKGFFDYIFTKQNSPRIISFNGKGFDIPVLKYRAMIHGISCPYFYNAGDTWNNYNHKYSNNWHCDLLEVLSDYGTSARVKMSEVCVVFGLPGKLGIDGAQVSEMYDNGQLNDIKDYCETDVINTYLIYLRYVLHRGSIKTQNYNKCVSDLISYLKSEIQHKKYAIKYLDALSMLNY